MVMTGDSRMASSKSSSPMGGTLEPPMASGGKLSFANMLGTKRRRMKSGGSATAGSTPVSPEPTGGAGPMGLSVLASSKKKSKSRSSRNGSAKNEAKNGEEGKEGKEKQKQNECKGGQTIPIFLKKTYKMIDTCDNSIACWTPDGEMFVVKDPDKFASDVIPQYFDHNKFSSFARQLNFYGFRKMQSKPIRKDDYDVDSARYVTFYNDKFKRGRCDLLKEIQRSTRGNTSANVSLQDQQKEVELLKEKVAALEKRLEEAEAREEDRLQHMEEEIMAKVNDLVVSALSLQTKPPQPQSRQQSLPEPTPIRHSQLNPPQNMHQQQHHNDVTWDPLPLGKSAQPSSLTDRPAQSTTQTNFMGVSPHPKFTPTPSSLTTPAPTLPPHPKQKQLPSGMPPAQLPPSLRSLSSAALGRLTSTESTASAVLLRNSWEDKFFSTLMLGDNSASASAAPTPGAQIGRTNTLSSQASTSIGFAQGGPVSDEAMAAAIAAATAASEAQQQRKQQQQQLAGPERSLSNEAILSVIGKLEKPSSSINRENTHPTPLEAPSISPSPSTHSLSSVSSGAP